MEVATLEKRTERQSSWSKKGRIVEMYEGSAYDNQRLAKAILEKYLQRTEPFTASKRKMFILSALKKFQYKQITPEGEKEMEKYILENYGTRGLNIVNSIKEF